MRCDTGSTMKECTRKCSTAGTASRRVRAKVPDSEARRRKHPPRWSAALRSVKRCRATSPASGRSRGLFDIVGLAHALPPRPEDLADAEHDEQHRGGDAADDNDLLKFVGVLL